MQTDARFPDGPGMADDVRRGKSGANQFHGAGQSCRQALNERVDVHDRLLSQLPAVRASRGRGGQGSPFARGSLNEPFSIAQQAVERDKFKLVGERRIRCARESLVGSRLISKI